MDPLASTSSLAASSVSLGLAALGGSLGAAGQDPTPASLSAQAQAGTQAQADLAVLRKVLDMESSEGTQLAQLVAGSVNLVA